MEEEVRENHEHQYLAVVLLTLMWTTQAVTREYCASPIGDDGNLGTPEQTLKTISAAHVKARGIPRYQLHNFS